MTFSKPRIAIIGAGLSGLTCARELTELGHDVSVFDKGRGPGGRASTRRVEFDGSRAGFDHGAQYFTVRDALMRERLDRWIESGVVSKWDGRIAALDAHGDVESYSQKPRFVGNPGMSALAQHFARGIDVHCGVQVARIERAAEGSRLIDREGNELGAFTAVIVTAPPVQTVNLLAEVAPAIAGRASAVEMKPCWALMGAFDAPVEVPYDGAFINHGPLSWVARTSSKPGRHSSPDRWVFHAGPSWSEANIELDRDEAARELHAFAAESMDVALADPIYLQAHRWRYAIAENPLDEGALYDPEVSIGACGDWTSGNRVEGAMLSGVRMAQLIADARDR